MKLITFLLGSTLALYVRAGNFAVRQTSCGSATPITVPLNSTQLAYTPGYPALYAPGQSCTWSYTTLLSASFIVGCSMNVPCTDTLLIGSKTYCGLQSPTITPVGSSLTISLKSTTGSGSLYCSVKAVVAPTTIRPPPPSTTRTPSPTTRPPSTTRPPTTRPPTTRPTTTRPTTTRLTTARPTTTRPSTSRPLSTPSPTTRPTSTRAPTSRPLSTPSPTTRPTSTRAPTSRPLSTPPSTTRPSTTPPPTSRAPSTLAPTPSPNCNCGIRGPNRIVGGSPAGRNEYPWMVMLFKYENQRFCGGSIIAPGWVVTAAHCTDGEDATTLSIVAGAHNSTTIVTGQRRRVTRVIQHALYNVASPVDSDIALLQLSEPLIFNTAVSPICLPQLKYATYDFASQTGIATGWGLTSDGTPAENLLEVSLPMLSTAQCRTYANVSAYITNNMLCTYLRERTPGDSGGPLNWVDATQRVYLAGITSFGLSPVCGDVGFPGIYVKVNNYISWIQQNTGLAFCSP